MNIFIRWIAAAAAVLVSSYVLPGIHVRGVGTALVLVVVLGLINTIIKPILLFLTLPVTVITLGLFTFVVSGLMVLLAARIVPGFMVDGFWWAVLFSIVLSLVNSFLGAIGRG